MADVLNNFPKIIWFVWFQGLDKAPYVVRRCHESWVKQNPGWTVRCLDEKMVSKFASVDYFSGNIGSVSPQHRSGLLRYDLLAHHGGVWADATTFCNRPLDEWLPKKMKSGFFAFHRPGPDRIVSTWFLASKPENVLVSCLFDQMFIYWNDHLFRKQEDQFILVRILVAGLARFLNSSAVTRRWWFTRPIRDWLSINPYFAHSYGLEKLIRENSECADIWFATPKISADGPHLLQKVGLLSQATLKVRSDIESRSIPIYKLTHRLGERPFPSGSCIELLFTSGAGNANLNDCL